MDEEYLTDAEFKTYFSELNNLRKRIAGSLPLIPGMNVLDLATGYGYFAIELLRRERELKITGIDISETDIVNAERNVAKNNLADSITITQMDATKMNFGDEAFDMAVNFLGLEDIHMTRGLDGVRLTFSEVNRVLKTGGYFCFTAMPPDRMETRAQQIEVALFSDLCGATWLRTEEYESMLKVAGFELVRKDELYTGKKLTADQIKEEIRFACENVPGIYGVPTPPFSEIWNRYRKDIEEYGVGHYSKVILFVARKS
jgi:cyclopropane fatty-acyl-phospholipid synthase-like methyltransferase